VLVGADEWESLQETLYWLSSVMRSSACARFPAGLSFVVDGDQGSSGCAFPPPGWSGDTPGKQGKVQGLSDVIGATSAYPLQVPISNGRWSRLFFRHPVDDGVAGLCQDRSGGLSGLLLLDAALDS
jgi:hypothetical protein